MFQQTSPPPTAPPTTESKVQREIKVKQSHSYRVHIEFEGNGAEQKLEYKLQLKVVENSAQPDKPDIEFKVENYTLHVLKQVKRAKLAGAGKLAMSPQGLPERLVTNVENSHLWYPMLTWYLPFEVKGDAFTVEEALGGGWKLLGSGHVKGSAYDMLCDIKNDNDTYKMAGNWTIEKSGWISRGSGEVTDATGTVKFSLAGH